MVSCMGVGFPLVSVRLEKGTDGNHLIRGKSKTFIWTLRMGHMHFAPHFFFSDKVTSQLKSNKSVFGIYPFIGLWHHMWAIKPKFRGLGMENSVDVDAKVKSRILSFVENHYFRGSAFIDATKATLCLKALVEHRSFCIDLEEIFFTIIFTILGILQYRRKEIRRDRVDNYIYENWYRGTFWCLWGREDGKKVALSWTAMKVLAHWSVLK